MSVCVCVSAFQLTDVDYFIGDPVKIGTSMTQFSQKQAILRMFGVNDAGNSVLAYVHNFMSYFYVPAWPGCTPEQINHFGQALNVRATHTRAYTITRCGANSC